MMTQLMLLEEAHRQQAEEGGQGGSVVPPNKNCVGGGGRAPPHVLVSKNTFRDVLTIPVTLATSEQLPSDNLRIT